MIKRIELFATQGTDYKNDWVSLGAPLNGSFERSICKEGYLEFYDIDYSKRTFVLLWCCVGRASATDSQVIFHPLLSSHDFRFQISYLYVR